MSLWHVILFLRFKKTEYFPLSLAGNVVIITYLQTEHYIQTAIVSFLHEQSALTGFLFGMSPCIRVDNLIHVIPYPPDIHSGDLMP